ncbi:MAG: UDP-4-amino-4,6-dideoxy-N-acetyl-beta-L-altrosamine transaminase [Patescibacteria group bacterium]
MKKFLPYGHQCVEKDDIKAVVEVLKGDWLTQGPKVAEFEKKVAQYCGVEYAVAVSSGTAALSAAYLAAALSAGDEVITTPLTFAATSNALVHCGGAPVFVDVEEETLNINPELIEKAITKKTKAIAVVDFAGHPCDLDKIKAIAKKHKLLIIEDAAHSLGAMYKDRMVGSMADLTTLSFHPVKLITTGEGGMVLTSRKDFYEKMLVMRHHGIVKKPAKGLWYYEIETPGHNFRLTDIQCALGISQLKKIYRFLTRRRQIAKKYQTAFSGLNEIILPTEKPYAKSAWHIFPIQFNLEKLKIRRKEIFEKLREQGLGVQVHYVPLHLQPFYQKKFGYKKGDFPVAETYYERAITLPLFPQMTALDIQFVIKAVKAVYAEIINPNSRRK